MTRRKIPMVFRLAAALLIGSAVFGQWWRHRPAGPHGRAFLTMVERHCPAAAVANSRPTVADTAAALDRWSFAHLAGLIHRDGRDRCRMIR